nr:hypothetical protein XfCFBP8356_09015 [Xylella fastidiosa subsp. sandyi]
MIRHCVVITYYAAVQQSVPATRSGCTQHRFLLENLVVGGTVRTISLWKMRAQPVSFLYPLSKHPAVLEGRKSRLLKRFGSLNYWLYVLMKMSKANNVCLVCACGAAVYVECGVSIRPQESVCLTLTKNDVTSRKIFIDGRCEAYQEDKSEIEITVLKGCARTGLNMLRSIFVCSGLGMVELPCVFIGCVHLSNVNMHIWFQLQY